MSAQGTPVPDNLKSPVGRKANPKAPSKVASKRRAVSGANGTAKRATRRELKKLVEVDLEEKDDVSTAIKKENTAAVPFGVDATSASITPTSLHDDFVNMMKTKGLEKIATEAGLLKNGALVESQASAATSAAVTPASSGRGKKSAPTASTLASPSFTSPSPGKKRKYLKINKGLRHFSMKVCQKVEEKHVTSYNEVADDLVREFVTMRPNDAVYDEKNIRRRVYDALNVLRAMDIISKERKEIRWKGLPSNLQHDSEMLLTERNERMKSVEQKKQHLQDLLVQQVAMKNLLKRNAERKRKESENPTAATIVRDEGRVFLPFIAVNTSKDTVIQCEMSEDRQDIFFNFSAPFEIHDDADILQKLNLHRAPYTELKQMVPDKLLSYLPAECETKSDE
ncbi:transcription factor Dp-1 [Phytophthora infestans T30-4]|uniref:Transcription factor Dp-1 n=2 Tax=Phytophthora infestans TaxID=4787 RepID=D0P1H1_PHYIT|nr:transcription factor Dp-1 [Phytophthora infestans T30-4]EEY54594.1 transcription factor Dp-1 [Phytophthora infestans T30-4]KAF4032144.1 Transcription factor DP domain-containing protein [Phytophthora infestans]KAF4042566.1 Transcription factor DP domain-containing protein [Phytophthora infestans]KAF4131174.1 Transcription factor DP domain-containing protein [Phytophthora infestans]|eukprot:XP_002895831.1 transcription factor Dp-1 [Phytophthora infestans T30-4]